MRSSAQKSHRVSILVFVELAPGVHTLFDLLLVEWFQSLFLWNSLPEFELLAAGGFRGVVFQSLFLWNSLPEYDDSPHSDQDISVSILVFAELAPGGWCPSV